MRVYRILRRQFAANPFDGEGSYRFGGRWSSPGTRIAYSSEHVSLAMLEYLVHMKPDRLAPDLVVARARIPSSVSTRFVKVDDLPANWRRTPAPPELAEIGDRFVEEGKAAVLIVPSVLAPGERNWLLNPRHRAFAKIRVEAVEKIHHDTRLLG